jgi:hypothetical protein
MQLNRLKRFIDVRHLASAVRQSRPAQALKYMLTGRHPQATEQATFRRADTVHAAFRSAPPDQRSWQALQNAADGTPRDLGFYAVVTEVGTSARRPMTADEFRQEFHRTCGHGQPTEPVMRALVKDAQAVIMMSTQPATTAAELRQTFEAGPPTFVPWQSALWQAQQDSATLLAAQFVTAFLRGEHGPVDEVLSQLDSETVANSGYRDESIGKSWISIKKLSGEPILERSDEAKAVSARLQMTELVGARIGEPPWP